MEVAAHLVAVGFGRGNVVLHGPGDGCPDSVDEAHDVVAQLRARPIQAGVLAFAHLHDNAQLRHVLQVLDVCAPLLQLPARFTGVRPRLTYRCNTTKHKRVIFHQHILYTVTRRE